MTARLAACLILALVATATAAARAAEITGPAHVIDASSIDIGGRPVRLYGIAAPAESQICERNGAAWRCGQDASWALAERLERHWVLCDTMDDAAPEASTAVCYLGGRQGLDVGAWLVEQGWALADPAATDYAAPEQAAQKAGRGLWAGKFELPQLSQRP